MTHNMETFYVRLRAEDCLPSDPMHNLLELTQMSLEDLASITSNLTWSVWD